MSRPACSEFTRSFSRSVKGTVGARRWWRVGKNVSVKRRLWFFSSSGRGEIDGVDRGFPGCCRCCTSCRFLAVRGGEAEPVFRTSSIITVSL